MERFEMKATDAIRAILAQEGITQTELAKTLGYAQQSAVSGRLNTTRPSIDKIGEILSVLGYEMVIRKVEGGEREYVVMDGIRGRTERGPTREGTMVADDGSVMRR